MSELDAEIDKSLEEAARKTSVSPALAAGYGDKQQGKAQAVAPSLVMKADRLVSIARTQHEELYQQMVGAQRQFQHDRVEAMHEAEVARAKVDRELDSKLQDLAKAHQAKLDEYNNLLELYARIAK